MSLLITQRVFFVNYHYYYFIFVFFFESFYSFRSVIFCLSFALFLLLFLRFSLFNFGSVFNRVSVSVLIAFQVVFTFSFAV